MQTYRLCLKAGDFSQSPTFKLRMGKIQKTINVYFISSSDKQRYNHDIILQRTNQTDLKIDVVSGGKVLGQGSLKFQKDKPDIPNQMMEIKKDKVRVGAIEYSLKRLDKIQKNPQMKIKILSGSYLNDMHKDMHPFIVAKFTDNNFKTNVCRQGGKNPEWKQEFNIGTSGNDRIFLQSWEEDQHTSSFIGISIVDISGKIGSGMVDIDVMKDKVKQGTLKIELMESQNNQCNQNQDKERNIKTYAVEAVMKNSIKKGGFVKLHVSEHDYETTPIFSQTKQLKWNQSFQIKCSPNSQIIAKLCLKQQIQQQVGRCIISVSSITNKKYQYSLTDHNGVEVGKLYLQFFDEQLDIKQDIKSSKSKQHKPVSSKSKQHKPVSEASKDKQPNRQLQQKFSKQNQEIRKRYANRQSIHDYMAEVNSVLQEGLLIVARDRPEDPIKNLGLFLINYKKQ